MGARHRVRSHNEHTNGYLCKGLQALGAPRPIRQTVSRTETARGGLADTRGWLVRQRTLGGPCQRSTAPQRQQSASRQISAPLGPSRSRPHEPRRPLGARVITSSIASNNNKVLPWSTTQEPVMRSLSSRRSPSLQGIKMRSPWVKSSSHRDFLFLHDV